MSAKISDLTVSTATGTSKVRVAESDGAGGWVDKSVPLSSIFTGANISVGNTFNTVELYADGNSIGGGEAATLSSLGYTSGTSNAAWPLSAAAFAGGTSNINPSDVTNLTPATMAWCEALIAMRSGPSHLMATGRSYIILKPATTYLPGPATNVIASNPYSNLSILIDGMNSLLKITGTGVQHLFYWDSVDMAAHNAAITTRKIIKNFVLRGNANASSKGIRLVSSKGGLMENIITHNFGIGIEALACQTYSMIGCNPVNNDIGISVGKGDWTGATSFDTVSQPYLINCHARVNAGGTGFKFVKCESPSLTDCGVEGAGSGEYGVYIDSTGSNVAKNASINRLRIEQQYTRAAIGIKQTDIGQVNIDTVFSQISSYLLEFDSPAGVGRVFLSNISDTFGKLRNLQSGTGTGNSYSFMNVKLPGNPVNIAEIIGSTDIWDTSGSYTLPPSAARIRLISTYIP